MNMFPPKNFVKFTEEQMAAVAAEYKKMHSCQRCEADMGFDYRKGAYCYKCEKIINEEKLNEKLDNIRDMYNIEERLRMIEKFIIQHQNGHPERNWVMR